MPTEALWSFPKFFLNVFSMPFWVPFMIYHLAIYRAYMLKLYCTHYWVNIITAKISYLLSYMRVIFADSGTLEIG